MKVVPAGELSSLVVAYVSEQVGAEVDDNGIALAILSDQDEFVGGIVLTNFSGFDIQFQLASETPMAWQDNVIRYVFDYVFNQLGCVRCTGVTKKGNRKARAFLEGLGFQLEGNVRLGYDGIKDALVYGLLASECKYLAPLEEAEYGSVQQGQQGEAASSTRSGADSGDGGEHQSTDGDNGSGAEPV